MEKFETPIADSDIEELSELELADNFYREVISEKNEDVVDRMTNFINREYFENFLGKLNKFDDTHLEKVGETVGVDIIGMRETVKSRVPELFEGIDSVEKDEKINIASVNSLRDVLGNSIVAVFSKIVYVVENFESDDPKARKAIDNLNSPTRKIIRAFSVFEGKTGLASYYMDELTKSEDNEVLIAELADAAGYLGKFSKCFQDVEVSGNMSKKYPSGSRKIPYFKFFREADKWKNEKGDQIKNKTDFRRALDDFDPSEEFIIKDEIKKYFLDK